MPTVTERPDLARLRELLPREVHEHMTLCLARTIDETGLDASFDFGATFVRVPLGEILRAEPVKQVQTRHGPFQLTQLYMPEEHPTIEIAALRSQVAHMRAYVPESNRSCDCAETTSLARQSREPAAGARFTGCWTECIRNTSGCHWLQCATYCAFWT